MPSNFTIRVFFAFLFLNLICLFNQNYGQIKVHTILDVEKGMVQSTVRAIFKDSQGYLWFGTNLGVSRWDGNEFKNYSPSDGLPGHIIYSIFEDKNGRIFFGTSSGAAYFRDNKFYKIPSIPSFEHISIKTIIETNDNKILFGSDSGIYYFDIDSDSLKIFDKSSLRKDILCGYKSKKGSIYFGTGDNEIIIYGRRRNESYHLPKSVSDAGVHSICENENGDMVFGLYNTIIVERKNSLENFSLQDNIDCGRINAISEAGNGNLWICTENSGAFLWKNKVIDKIDKNNGFGNDNIISVLNASDGTTYFGLNSGGVGIVNRYGIYVFNEKTGLANNNITSICEGSDGSFLFGTRESGVTVVKGNYVRNLRVPDELCCEQILKIFKSKNGTMYFGTNSGVTIWDNRKVKLLNAREGLPSDIVLDIEEGRDGTMYFATSKGLGILKNGIVNALTKSNGLSDDFITSVAVSSDGRIYAGTFFGGLNIINGRNISVIKDKNGLLGNNVLSLFLDNNQDLWIGTSNGLNVIRGGKIFNSFTTEDGLSSNIIYGITEDKEGRQFLATNKGVNILDVTTGNASVHTLLTEDGIVGEECNLGAMFTDNNGFIWVGTIKGAVRFDPKKIVPNEIPPKIRLESVLVNNESLPALQNSVLTKFAYNENYFTFNFASVNLTSPKRVKYGYRMLGLDKDWIITTQSSVQYANLAEGNYRFQVKAQNEWGVWSSENEYSFLIVPPFWRTWWFIMLVLLFIAGTIAYFLTKRVKRLLAFERLRLKIAADLHDNIGAGLTEISILSEILKQKKSGNDEAKFLDDIAVRSRQLIESMRDIVWIVNPKQDSLHDLILRLEDSFSEIMTFKGISFQTDNLDTLKKVSLPMDYRQHLYLIFKEGINNSIKYSRCSKLELKAKLDNRILQLALSDNGVGIHNHNGHKGNGIQNMQERARKIGGMLKIDSTESIGTTITYSGKI